MKRRKIKSWLDNVLEAWEDFKELETDEAPDKMVEQICKLYTKRELARAILILRPLEKLEQKPQK